MLENRKGKEESWEEDQKAADLEIQKAELMKERRHRNALGKRRRTDKMIDNIRK